MTEKKMMKDGLVDRYARQIALPEIGVQGQARLASARVLVIGAGGLGSPCLQYLAAAGVGRVGVVDDDAVDESNLQRQVLHRTEDVGRPKVDSARDALLRLNPTVEIERYACRFDESNAAELLSGWAFVIDATDNFDSKFLISDSCVKHGVPYAHGGISRYYGQCMTVLPEKSACYRCVFDAPPADDDGPVAGPFGALPGIIGSAQAAEAIKYAAGFGELLTDRVLTCDTLTMAFRVVPVRRRQGCCACGSSYAGSQPPCSETP